MTDTIVWISGANHGIGLGIARKVPYRDARIVNLSNERHADFETVLFDLREPSTWQGVREHFARELGAFKGSRAIFVQNAHVVSDTGMVGKVDADAYAKGLIANGVAPIALAEGFIRACKPGYESGVAMISSESAEALIPSLTSYCAAKAGIEQWVMAVKRERAAVPSPWIVAVRPGFTDTPTARGMAALDGSVYPGAASVRAQLEAGRSMTIDEAGEKFWRLIPPEPGAAVIRMAQAHSVKPLGVIKRVDVA
jgi:benzil reductase ((S)-benzoin forming)